MTLEQFKYWLEGYITGGGKDVLEIKKHLDRVDNKKYVIAWYGEEYKYDPFLVY